MINLNNAGPKSLAKILGIHDADGFTWQKTDLAGILAHQLKTPLEVDLRQTDPEQVTEFSTKLGRAASFGDLFNDPSPPLELLVNVKQFAKQFLTETHHEIPADVATVVYYTAIAVARVRCQRRITELADESLKTGLEWSLRQVWIDAQTQLIFRDGLAVLRGAEGDCPDPSDG